MPLDLINNVVRLVTVLLEGVPPEIRLANAKVWFFLWWPIGRRILARGGTTEAELAELESKVRDAK